MRCNRKVSNNPIPGAELSSMASHEDDRNQIFARQPYTMFTMECSRLELLRRWPPEISQLQDEDGNSQRKRTKDAATTVRQNASSLDESKKEDKFLEERGWSCDKRRSLCSEA
ncbi:hypothetical protein CIHG_07344 [Coccidioides immitis H538.4]|uniref:Uncharacterized protein n=2 Tax=Coccidioides immitis TaxID=5501 RepID=A0A0J8UPT4_COCIT|nr:hypothetical protein CIRG_00674 [Coccidioides immitis RMSCC 2394]KMU89538.1 hypothetical protein CIHG_07344 [Coccidioides immitis H538.4]